MTGLLLALAAYLVVGVAILDALNPQAFRTVVAHAIALVLSLAAWPVLLYLNLRRG